MWIFVEASLICSCWMSVLTATKSTWVMPASIMRSTAFSPAPPTPTTRMTARYDAESRARSSRAGCSGSGSSQRASGRSRRSDAGSGSGAGATARIGATFSRGAGGFCCVLGGSTGSSCWRSADSCSFAWRWAASVARNRSASGPSRMLALFLAIEHLLRKVTVQRSCVALRLVGEHGESLHGSLGEADRLPDPCLVDEIAEVLAEDLVGLARVGQALVEHRRDDSDDLDLRIQVLAHH